MGKSKPKTDNVSARPDPLDGVAVAAEPDRETGTLGGMETEDSADVVVVTRGAVRTVMIEIPLCPIENMPERAHENRHVDISRLDIRSARIWKRLTIALDLLHERLASGRHINASRPGGGKRAAGDAVRWLLEKIAEADEEERRAKP